MTKQQHRYPGPMPVPATCLHTRLPQGSSSGWLLSPDSLSPLAAGPPLHAALQLLGLMGGLEAAPGTAGPAYADGSTCALAHVRFFAGSCAMSINWPTQFKVRVCFCACICMRVCVHNATPSHALMPAAMEWTSAILCNVARSLLRCSTS